MYLHAYLGGRRVVPCQAELCSGPAPYLECSPRPCARRRCRRRYSLLWTKNRNVERVSLAKI